MMSEPFFHQFQIAISKDNFDPESDKDFFELDSILTNNLEAEFSLLMREDHLFLELERYAVSKEEAINTTLKELQKIQDLHVLNIHPLGTK